MWDQPKIKQIWVIWMVAVKVSHFHRALSQTCLDLFQKLDFQLNLFVLSVVTEVHRFNYSIHTLTIHTHCPTYKTPNIHQGDNSNIHFSHDSISTLLWTLNELFKPSYSRKSCKLLWVSSQFFTIACFFSPVISEKINLLLLSLLLLGSYSLFLLHYFFTRSISLFSVTIHSPLLSLLLHFKGASQYTVLCSQSHKYLPVSIVVVSKWCGVPHGGNGKW